MSEKLTLPGEIARDILADDSDEFQAVVDKIVDTDRWSEIYRIVIRDSDGRFWEGSYSRGATEQQYEIPWEYEDAEFVEVERYEKTVIDYKIKREESAHV